ncbi:MAG: MaoC family dehydratase N-terminal domain-containing protein [Acidimicrobiales bacterium]
MADIDFDRYIGMSTASGTVTVERATVSAFAASVLDQNPVYHNAEKAKAAGFDNVPASPTFFFSAAKNWGMWEEDQPAKPAQPAEDPMGAVMGGLMAGGGLILHGEQEFTYHRAVVAGEKLQLAGTVRDIYQKPTGDKIMTFMVIEDVFSDDDGEPVVTAVMNLIHRSA